MKMFKQRYGILLIFLISLTNVSAQEIQTENFEKEIQNSKTTDKTIILVYSNIEWIGNIQDGNYISYDIQGTGNEKFLVNCGNTDTITYSINTLEPGLIEIHTIRQGNILDHQTNSKLGKTIETTVNCNGMISILQDNTVYYMIPIIIGIISAIVLILKKKPISGPRKFRT